ncbi:Uncharacterised protein [Klebsiella pneumoniae]|nr:Uncharacterised protein [Klebsiella pneumoniae]
MTDEAVAALPRGANNFGETVDIGAMWMWREMQLQFRGLATDERKIVAVNCGVGGQIIEHLSKGHSWDSTTGSFQPLPRLKPLLIPKVKPAAWWVFYILAMNITMTAQKEGRQTAQNTEHS